MEILAELSYEGELTSVDSFLSQSLWNNSLIRIMGKRVYYKNWYQMGISTVSDIIKEKPNSFFLQRNLKLNITLGSPTYYGITSSLKTLWTRLKSNTTINASSQESICNCPDEIKETKPIGVPNIIGNKMRDVNTQPAEMESPT